MHTPSMYKPFKIMQVLTFAILLCAVTFVNAAPKSRLISYWDASDELNKTVINHHLWQNFLDKYVQNHPSGINRVNYVAVSDYDKKQLDLYVNTNSAIAIRSYSKAEQFSYWVNLYNATTVQVILQQYPVQSITKISYGLFSFGPWDEPLLTVENQKISLNDIEHGILRPIWKDRRIHYVVNCASIGCPNLSKQALTAANTQALLQKAEKDYITHPRGFVLKGDKVTLSKIFDWYQVDFGKNPKEIVNSFKTFFPSEEDQERFELWLTLPKSRQEIEYIYDWSLNKP